MSRYYGKKPVTVPVVLVPATPVVVAPVVMDTPVDDEDDVQVDEEFEDSEDDS